MDVLLFDVKFIRFQLELQTGLLESVVAQLVSFATSDIH